MDRTRPATWLAAEQRATYIPYPAAFDGIKLE